VEKDETFEEAAIREMREETGRRTRTVKLIWRDACESTGSDDRCYLMELEEDQSHSAVLGFDPEEQHLPVESRQLQGIAWMPIGDVADDVQVARVLTALRPNE